MINAIDYGRTLGAVHDHLAALTAPKCACNEEVEALRARVRALELAAGPGPTWNGTIWIAEAAPE